MAEERRIVIPYAPRAEQQRVHDAIESHRFSVVVCHRRWGKTVASINHAIREALSCVHERPRVAYIAPSYRQAKLVAWDYAKHYSSFIPGVEYNESELRIDYPNGGRLRLLGAETVDSIRGIYLDFVVLDEYALMAPRAWGEVIRPTLIDRKGKALWIGTPMGQNHLYTLWQAARDDDSGQWWQTIRPASQTGLIPADELAAAAKTMSAEQYAQELECSWTSSVPGSYYGRLMDEADRDGRITSVPYDSHAKTYSAWDLGIGDSTSIWVMQICGKEHHAIDFYEASGEPLAHYAAWLKSNGYPYEAHALPHDAAARELQTGKSRVEALLALGIRATVLPPTRVEDGIEEVRRLLPMTWFDVRKCSAGINALRNYRSDYDDKHATLRRTPLHDWSSHAADAFRQYAMMKHEKKTRDPIDYPKLGIV